MFWDAPEDWIVSRHKRMIYAVSAPDFPVAGITYLAGISESRSQATIPNWQHVRVKNSKSAVYRVSDGQTTYYSKHYTNRAFCEQLKAMLRPPLRSVAVGVALEKDGLPVPRSMAALTIRRGGFRMERIFVCREVPGKLLRDAIADGDLDSGKRMHLAHTMGKIWGMLHSKGYLHMDPISGNFMHDAGNSVQPIHVIDLDNIYRVPAVLLTSKLPFSARRLTKFAYRLSRQLVEQGQEPIRQDEWRCFRRAYVAAGGDEGREPLVWWDLIRRLVEKRWLKRFATPYPHLP